MTSALKAELAKLTLTEKLALNDVITAQIQAEIEAVGCPPGVLREGDPRLEMELDRRASELIQYPERGHTLQEVDALIAQRLGRRA